MTPAQVYEMPEVFHSNGISVMTIDELCSFTTNHFPEVDLFELSYDKVRAKGDITVVTHAYHYEDFRRYWALWSAWFRGKPFMVLQNAGREGSDHNKRFVTSAPLYWDAIDSLRTCYKDSGGSCRDIYSYWEHINELDSFYGMSVAEALRENPPKGNSQ